MFALIAVLCAVAPLAMCAYYVVKFPKNDKLLGCDTAFCPSCGHKFGGR